MSRLVTYCLRALSLCFPVHNCIVIVIAKGLLSYCHFWQKRQWLFCLTNLVAQNDKGNLVHPVTLMKSSRLAGESLNRRWQALSNFFISHPLVSEPALNAPWTTCRLQLPKSMSFDWPISCLLSFILSKSFKFTLGPSIETWTIFPVSKILSPSWRDSCKSVWVVWPKILSPNIYLQRDL